MAPRNKLKTYGRSNKKLVSNTFDAKKILFHKNKPKARRKQKLLIPELPPRNNSDVFLGDDSLHVCTEDTFDKLAKGSVYNPVNIQSHISIVNSSQSDASQSTVNKTSSFYSPIITRRKKKMAVLAEVSNKKNKSDSTLPHLKQPSVENIDFSLEVENVHQPVLNSLSYIKIPEIRGEVSINVLPNEVNMTKSQLLYDPIFTKTFREKQIIHSSTPLVLTKTKKLINHTISPIRNISYTKGESDVMPQNISTVLKSPHQNIVSTPDSNWKLKATPQVNLKPFADSFLGFDISERELALKRLQRMIDELGNDNQIDNSLQEKKSTPRKSFITLRRRKILKHDKSIEINKSKRNSRKETKSFKEQIEITNEKENVAQFNTFEELSIASKNKSLSDNLSNVESSVESFETKNQELSKIKVCQAYSGKLVAKKRHRLTDSYLISNKRQKIIDTSISQDTSRRQTLQQISLAEHGEFAVRDLLVVLPKTDVHISVKNKAKRSAISGSNTDFGTSSSGSSVVSNDFFRLKNPIFNDVTVNLTKLAIDQQLCTLDSCTNCFNCNSSQFDASKSLFGSSGISSYRDSFVNKASQTFYDENGSTDGSDIVNQNEILNLLKESIGSNISSHLKNKSSCTKKKSDDKSIFASEHSFIISENCDSCKNNEQKENASDWQVENSGKFYYNTINQSNSTKSELYSNNVSSSLNVKKELGTNLTKSQGCEKDEPSISTSRNSKDISMIDLTELCDSKNIRKSVAVNDISAVKDKEDRRVSSQSLSDIIESSVLESSQVDKDGFKMPVISNPRKRNSKILLLKAGKLWRRSFSVYKRSSMMVTVMNDSFCKVADGNVCTCPKCSLAKQCMRMSNRRLSIKIVPATLTSSTGRKISILENYAHNASKSIKNNTLLSTI